MAKAAAITALTEKGFYWQADSEERLPDELPHLYTPRKYVGIPKSGRTEARHHWRNADRLGRGFGEMQEALGGGAHSLIQIKTAENFPLPKSGEKTKLRKGFRRFFSSIAERDQPLVLLPVLSV